MFVRVNEGQYAVLGIGKLIDRKGTRCAVEFFDMPTVVPVVVEIESNLLKRETLAQQTRVYHFNELSNSWEIGRLLDDHGDSQLIQFPNRTTKHLNVSSVFVRWDNPISDPTPLLAHRINESPRYSDPRSAFIRSQLNQRAASLGMSALLSCAVELEAHQVDIVRRVLQDPVQRYLLADEVGLGKTVEAGVLIRQCVIDTQQNCLILVIVPNALVRQWRDELTSKFFLGSYLDRNIHVVAFDNSKQIEEFLPKVTMLVIDEAHHLTERRANLTQEIYDKIAATAERIDRVLLLSATPVLHNERGFLAMLHLLDPSTYKLDAENAFHRRIENRQAIAEIVAGLTPENVFYLEYTIDQIVDLFPDDDLVQQHSKTLRAIVETMPDESDPELIESIGRLHAHLSEVYRLDRRILRHRRRNIRGLTPDRSGAEIIRYRSNDRGALTEAIEDWRFGEALKLDTDFSEKLKNDRVRTFRQVLDRTSQYPGSGAGTVGFLARQAMMIGDVDRYSSICQCLGRTALYEDRADALIDALSSLLQAKAECVVFCSDPQTADMLAKRIADKIGISVCRHDPESSEWQSFLDDNENRVLVCDRRAEEGLNLQGGKKVLVHYDLPFNANRIEQRLGRADRYGSGDAVRSLVLACEDDPYELAWIAYLDTALKVFDRSAASLQYLIEQSVGGIEIALLMDGVEALVELTNESAGEQGLIEREFKAIDQQDALDALSVPPEDLIDELYGVDDEWQDIARNTVNWLEKMLQFRRIEEQSASKVPSSPFRYVYSIENPRTLVPLQTFMEHCSSALDLNLNERRGKSIQTIPYTFRRRTALNRNARASGVGLLRYGDALISGVTAFTDADDRGRSFAMWRFDPALAGEQLAEIYLRFDFVLEADITIATTVLREQGRETDAAKAAIRRRGDMALPPFYHSIWLNRELEPVTDEALITRLMQPYSVEPDINGAVDFNLNEQRWKRLLQLPIPELDFWSDLCGKARVAAETALRTLPALIESLDRAEQRALHVDLGRIGQLRARVNANNDATDASELNFEERLAAALRTGIRSPSVRVDTVGVAFISARRDVTKHVSGGF